MCIGAVLLALVVNIGIACAADGQELQADLNVTKIVSSTGPYESGDEVTWVITLWNNGPGNATNISVREDVTGLTGLFSLTAVPSVGEYNSTTDTWNITELKNDTYATLTLTTTFSTPGEKINAVTITLEETDPVVTDNSASVKVLINATDITPPPGPQADLSISKTVTSTGPYDLGDNVTWVVTLHNNGPGNATNITVTEDVAGLFGLHSLIAVPSAGEFNTATNLWKIMDLQNDTSANLTLTTNFSTSGIKRNNVSITAHDQADPDPTDNSAHATVQFNTTNDTIPSDSHLSANLVIRPTTLNLNSKGVFTVYVTIAGLTDTVSANQRTKPIFDETSSSFMCEGAEMIRASVSNKDGGTLIAKFHRYDLENVTSNNGVKINCSGTLVVNDQAINIEGSDTIRVIGEKKGLDKILSGLWKFLGVEKDDISINEGDDGNITVSLSLNPENFRNPGLAKKILKYEDNESAARDDNQTRMSVNVREAKEQPSKNTDKTKQINKNNANNKNQNDNGDKDQQNDQSHGKSNGKKD
jgi:uncharacterized repeat protein (TIGR01451 family)